VEYFAPNREFLRADNLTVSLKFARTGLGAMVTKIWDSTSNNEIIVWSTSKGLDVTMCSTEHSLSCGFNVSLRVNQLILRCTERD